MLVLAFAIFVITGCRRDSFIKVDHNITTYGGFIFQTADEGFMIVGTGSALINGDNMLRLSKVDGNGDYEWSRIIKDANWSFEKAHYISANSIPGGGFVLFSTCDDINDDTPSGNYESSFIARFSSSADLVWMKVFSTYMPNSNSIMPEKILVNANEEIFAVGNSYSRTVILKFLGNGELVWSRALVWEEEGNHKSFGASLFDGDGVVVCGHNFEYDAKTFVSVIDRNGSIQWSKYYNFNDPFACFKRIIQTSDGNLAITGYLHGNYDNVNRALIILRLFRNGTIIWRKSLANSDFESEGYSILEDGDKLVVFGRRRTDGSTGHGLATIAIFKTEDGELLNSKLLRTGEHNLNIFHSAVLTKDGKYAVSGLDWPNTETTQASGRLLFAKVDVNGCDDYYLDWDDFSFLAFEGEGYETNVEISIFLTGIEIYEVETTTFEDVKVVGFEMLCGGNCSESFYTEDCITTCYNVFSNSSDVCSGGGNCINYNQCFCEEEYYGEKCDVFVCAGGLSNETGICSGVGKCNTETGVCDCFGERIGDNCQTEVEVDISAFFEILFSFVILIFLF